MERDLSENISIEFESKLQALNRHEDNIHKLRDASPLERLVDESARTLQKAGIATGTAGLLATAASHNPLVGKASAATIHRLPALQIIHSTEHRDSLYAKRQVDPTDTYTLGQSFSSIEAIAEHEISEGHASNLGRTVEEIEQQNHLGKLAARNHRPVWLEAHYLPKGSIIKFSYMKDHSSYHNATVDKPGSGSKTRTQLVAEIVPAGSCVDKMAASNGETEAQVLQDNPELRSDPNYIQAGSLLEMRVPDNTSSSVGETTPTRHELVPGHDKKTRTYAKIKKDTSNSHVSSSGSLSNLPIEIAPKINPSSLFPEKVRHLEKHLPKLTSTQNVESRVTSFFSHFEHHPFHETAMERLDLKHFHPSEGAISYFENETLPRMQHLIPLYMKAAALEGVPQNWEILPALHGPELNFGMSYTWNGIANCNVPDAGPAGPFQETSCELTPYLSDPELGPTLSTLINSEGQIIPHEQIDNKQLVVLARIALRHWVQEALGSSYEHLRHGPIHYREDMASNNAWTHIMGAWNPGDVATEGFNGYGPETPYNPTAAVNPGAATTYFLIKDWEQHGGLEKSGIKPPAVWLKAMEHQHNRHPVAIYPEAHKVHHTARRHHRAAHNSSSFGVLEGIHHFNGFDPLLKLGFESHTRRHHHENENRAGLKLARLAVSAAWKAPVDYNFPNPRYNKLLNEYNPVGKSVFDGSDCQVLLSTLEKADGLKGVPDFGVSNGLHYMLDHPKKFKQVGELTRRTKLLPGDILVIDKGTTFKYGKIAVAGDSTGGNDHTLMYVGKLGGRYPFVEASMASHSAQEQTMGNTIYQDPLNRGHYAVFRLK
ncbi:MAG TPA: hypothetical protein VFN51_03285 [Candidatus Saccharimonadales bacterium]|nr:hypothetical protein [Candidatus Saccharimonadales bacterium]